MSRHEHYGADVAAPLELDETPDLQGAFPRLSSEQLQVLSALGIQREVQAGDVLYREGDTSCDFFVILSGKVAIVEDFEGPHERVVSMHGPGRFLGEISLLTGRGPERRGVSRRGDVRRAGRSIGVGADSAPTPAPRPEPPRSDPRPSPGRGCARPSAARGR